MNKTEQETPFSKKTIKFRPHIIYIYIYIYIGPFNRPGRLLKGWHLFPFHPVIEDWTFYRLFMRTLAILWHRDFWFIITMNRNDISFRLHNFFIATVVHMKCTFPRELLTVRSVYVVLGLFDSFRLCSIRSSSFPFATDASCSCFWTLLVDLLF